MIRTLALLSTLALAAPAIAQNTPYETLPIGPGCGDAEMLVSYENIGHGSKKLVLEATNFYPREFGVIVFGLDDIRYNVLNCPVYTVGIWGHTFQTDTAGYHKWERGWPQNVYAFFRIQMGNWRIGAMGFEVQTTNAAIIQHLQP